MLKSWTYKLDTAFAENTLAKIDIGNRAVILPHSAPERLIHSSADKIDINDCTLDGKHTLHATLYTTWQQRFLPYHVVTLKSMTPAKHATFAFPGVMNTIFHASGTGVTTKLQFDNGIQDEWFETTLSESSLGLKTQSIDHYIFIQRGGYSRTRT